MTLNYRITPEKLLYTTYSTGFRAGGFNRNPFVAAYRPDFLTNYEIGWKTEWAGRTLRFNGALFSEDWKDTQYGVNGAYAITQYINAGRSRTEGIESSLEWQALDGLNLSTSGTYMWKHELTELACYTYAANGTCAVIAAPAGTKMPVAAATKANVSARYDWSVAGLKAHAQAAAVYQSSARSQLSLQDAGVTGDIPGYTSADLSTGVAGQIWNLSLNVENAFDAHGQASRYLSCSSNYCTNPYVVPVRPRTITLQFGQKF